MGENISQIMLEQLKHILKIVEKIDNDVKYFEIRILSLEKEVALLHFNIAKVVCLRNGFDKRLTLIEKQQELQELQE